MSNVNLQIIVPEMTIEKYAEETGLTKRTVDGMIQRGYLPSVKTGKRRMVNVALRVIECLETKGG